jgi:Icc-related predicted phosphoesterase
MQYHIISDLHLEFHQDVTSVKTLLEKFPHLTCTKSAPAETILLLAGDIGSWFYPNLKLFLTDCSNQYKHVLYILGNHEYYSEKNHTMTTIEELAKTQIDEINGINEKHNLYFLNKTSVHIDGVKYLGATLWTDIAVEQVDMIEDSINDYKLIKKTADTIVTAYDTSAIHKTHVEWLTEELKDTKTPTVIITHHLPTSKLSHPKYAIYRHLASSFFTNLEDMIQPNLILWVCGHTHSYMKTQIADTTLITSPFGYEHECGSARIEYFSF